MLLLLLGGGVSAFHILQTPAAAIPPPPQQQQQRIQHHWRCNTNNKRTYLHSRIQQHHQQQYRHERSKQSTATIRTTATATTLLYSLPFDFSSSSSSSPLLLLLNDWFVSAQATTTSLLLLSSNPNGPTINLFESYSTLLQQYPITTKSITASILACIGDAIAQYRSMQNQQQIQLDQMQQQQQQLEQQMQEHYNNNNNNNNNNEITTQQQQQQPIIPKFEYDIKRGVTFLLFGALYTGAFQHYWFHYLSQHITEWGKMIGIWEQGGVGPNSQAAVFLKSILDGTRHHEWFTCFDLKLHMDLPPSPAAIAVGKVVLNQFVVVPIVYMPLFFAMTNALAKLDIDQSIARIQNLYIPLLLRNYVFWLPVQFAQFWLIPIPWQIPIQAVASLLWTIILSSIGANANNNTNNNNNNNNSSTTPVPAAAAAAAETEQLLLVPELSATTSTVIDSATTTTATTATTDLVPSAVLMDSGISSTSSINEQEDYSNTIITVQQQPVLLYAGAAVNEIEDDVTIEQIIPEPVLDTVKDVLSDSKKSVAVKRAAAASGGFAIGLLSAAADEALFGTSIGTILGGEAALGVAVISAFGAGVGILTANAAAASAMTSSSSNDQQQQRDEKDDNDNDNYGNNNQDVMEITIDNNVEETKNVNTKDTEESDNKITTNEIVISIENNDMKGFMDESIFLHGEQQQQQQKEKEDIFLSSYASLHNTMVHNDVDNSSYANNGNQLLDEVTDFRHMHDLTITRTINATTTECFECCNNDNNKDQEQQQQQQRDGTQMSINR